MSEKLQLFVMFFPVFLFSLSFHEWAHAWTAHRAGDATPQGMGRLTLNPIVHMDFVGTFLLPLIVFLSPGLSIPIAGWAKPVPVNPVNFDNWRWDMVKVASAGPISNLCLAVFFSFLMHLLQGVGSLTEFAIPEASEALIRETVGILYSLFRLGIYINLGLAFFNLIPVHPLDGGKVLEGFLPREWQDLYNRVAQYGILIIFVAYYLGFMKILWIPVGFFSQLLIPGHSL
jgi:Zn-dependent protease